MDAVVIAAQRRELHNILFADGSFSRHDLLPDAEFFEVFAHVRLLKEMVEWIIPFDLPLI
jgi:hypothetical protein